MKARQMDAEKACGEFQKRYVGKGNSIREARRNKSTISSQVGGAHDEP
jgi:hypothetical protein